MALILKLRRGIFCGNGDGLLSFDRLLIVLEESKWCSIAGSMTTSVRSLGTGYNWKYTFEGMQTKTRHLYRARLQVESKVR